MRRTARSWARPCHSGARSRASRASSTGRDTAMTDVARRVEQLFEESGAYRQGHFKLKSGRHGDRYLEKFQVLQWPERVAEICRYMADAAVDAAGRKSIDVVVGPTTGGVLLAYEVAKRLGVRGFFAESV